MLFEKMELQGSAGYQRHVFQQSFDCGIHQSRHDLC